MDHDVHVEWNCIHYSKMVVYVSFVKQIYMQSNGSGDE